MKHTPVQVPIYRHGKVAAYALVDKDDYPRIGAHTWRLHGRPSGTQYAFRNGKIAGRGITTYMHRELLGLLHGDRRQVDHLNRDGLDNRRENLRVVTQAENGQNRSSHRGSSSRYRGVYWDSLRGKWRAKSRLNGAVVHIGYFTDEVAAARAARAWRLAHMPFANEAVQP